MPTTHRRRIVRRAVMALAAMVLMMGWYVSSYGTCRFLAGRAKWNTWWYRVMGRLEPVVFEPVHVYQWSGLPGDITLQVFGEWCYYRGSGRPVPWGEVRKDVESKRPPD